MKKSINLYCNDLDSKYKLLQIKEAGYDEFFTGYYDAGESLKLKQQIKFAKKIGLGCTMIHCSYDESILNEFWEEGKTGDNICRDYIKQIRCCKHLCKNFVVHLQGSKACRHTEYGLTRIGKMLKVCERYDINLCIENLYLKEEIIYIFDNLSHKNLKICYDCGHQNFLTPTFDVFKKYAPFIEVLHIHENDGKTDQHKILSVNSKVFNSLKKGLKKLKEDIVLACELKNLTEDFKKSLKQNLLVLANLEE